MDDRRKETIEAYLGKTVSIVVDRPIGYVHGDIVYPVNYGYIPGVIGGDGEEQDAYLLGVDKPVGAFCGTVIGIVFRGNDCEEKLVIAPEGTLFHQGQIAEMVAFQEQYFDSYVVSSFQKSCGVLPYKQKSHGREFLIVFEQHSRCWSLPKGHMEAGETELQTALRELHEETGLTAQLDAKRAAVVEYPIAPGICKQVKFFLGEVSGTPRNRAGEICDHRWVTRDQLGQYLHGDTVNACMKLLEL